MYHVTALVVWSSTGTAQTMLPWCLHLLLCSRNSSTRAPLLFSVFQLLFCFGPLLREELRSSIPIPRSKKDVWSNCTPGLVDTKTWESLTHGGIKGFRQTRSMFKKYSARERLDRKPCVFGNVWLENLPSSSTRRTKITQTFGSQQVFDASLRKRTARLHLLYTSTQEIKKIK